MTLFGRYNSQTPRYSTETPSFSCNLLPPLSSKKENLTIRFLLGQPSDVFVCLTNGIAHKRETPMTAADEQHIIHRAKTGDNGAFRLLVSRHMKQAYNIAYSIVQNHQDAEEAAQDAFVRAFRFLEKFREDSEFSTWLYRIVVNVSLNSVKKMKRRTSRETDCSHALASAAGDDMHSQENSDAMQHFEKVLHDLPTMQRAVVILRHLDGLSTKQVSSILQCSEGTVKTHLFRGLRNLRERLEFIRQK